MRSWLTLTSYFSLHLTLYFIIHYSRLLCYFMFLLFIWPSIIPLSFKFSKPTFLINCFRKLNCFFFLNYMFYSSFFFRNYPHWCVQGIPNVFLQNHICFSSYFFIFEETLFSKQMCISLVYKLMIPETVECRKYISWLLRDDLFTKRILVKLRK